MVQNQTNNAISSFSKTTDNNVDRFSMNIGKNGMVVDIRKG